MSRTIAGTLTTPAGAPIAGATLTFRALETSLPGVPYTSTSSTTTTTPAGDYTITLQPNTYEVAATIGGSAVVLGTGVLTAGATITLPQFLGSTAVPESFALDLLDRVIALEAGGGGGPGGGLPPLAAGPADEIVSANAAGTALARTGQTLASLLAAARDRATHTGSQLASTISDLASAVGALLTWSGISGKPSTFPPEAHTHPSTDISDSTTVGRSVLTASTGADARTAIGAEAAGAAASAVTAHEAAVDPHSQYATDSDLSAHTGATAGAHGISAFGASLIDDATAGDARTTLGLGDSATRNVGTAAGTVAAGDDSRLSDARTPTAHGHPLSDLAQSGATTGQVPAWNGSAWVATTPTSGGGSPGGSDGQIQYRIDASTFGGAPLWRVNADTLAQRNGTNPQTLEVYNTATASLTNFERGFMRWTSNVFEVGTQAGGTGSNRTLRLVSPTGTIELGTGHGNAATAHSLTFFNSGGGLAQGGTLNCLFGGLSWNGANAISSTNGFRAQNGAFQCNLNFGSPAVNIGFSAQPGSNNINGGSVTITAQDGSSIPSNNRSGGNIILNAGQGFGTGVDGDIIVGQTRGQLRLPVLTVATLPAATVAGRRCFVNDATATTFHSIVAGGGSNFVPVFSDGTDWRIG